MLYYKIIHFIKKNKSEQANRQFKSDVYKDKEIQNTEVFGNRNKLLQMYNLQLSPYPLFAEVKCKSFKKILSNKL